MIAIPFVYFSFLSILFYRKNNHKIDLSVVITAIYAVSGFFSILIDVFGFRSYDIANYKISFSGAFAYCALLTLCILPFAANSHLKISAPKPLKHSFVLKFFAILSAVWFLWTVFVSRDLFVQMITSDMHESRSLALAGELDSALDDVPGPLRPLMVILNLIFSCNWVLLFLAFFSRYIQRLPRFFFWIYLFASLSGPYDAVLGAYRSSVAYWILSAFGIYLLFRPFISKNENKQLIRIYIIILSLLVVYLAMMTIGRFMESSEFGDNGAQGSLIYYFGVSYINFCNFFDNYTPPYPNLGIIFPFIGKYVFGIETGGVVIQEQMSLLTNFECGTFYTFIGQIIMGAGTIVAIGFCLLYSFTSFVALPFAIKKSKIHNLYLYFSLASVDYLGLFVYFYTSPYKTFSLIFFYIMLKFSK